MNEKKGPNGQPRKSTRKSIGKSLRKGLRRRGITLIYATVAMGALCGLTSLAVDYGRVQIVKEQLHAAADAAARAGAGGLATNYNQAINQATLIATQNTADGSPITLNASQDIQVGTWTTDANGNNGVFTPGAAGANAVHVTLHRSQARGNGVQLMFAKVLGAGFCDVQADCIAELIPAINVNQSVLATANPFLSGTTAGAEASVINPHNNPDYAGNSTNAKESPQVVSIPLDANAPLTFDSISGTARHDPNLPDYEPDGETDNVGHNNLSTSESGDYSPTFNNENGITDMNCPINALVGVFLDDSDPRTSNAATPTNQDFSTDASRNAATYHPALKQLFFIGDGLTDNGQVQSFIPPKGATRLFLATWDFYEWNNNSGQRTVLVSRPQKIVTVR